MLIAGIPITSVSIPPGIGSRIDLRIHSSLRTARSCGLRRPAFVSLPAVNSVVRRARCSRKIRGSMAKKDMLPPPPSPPEFPPLGAGVPGLVGVGLPVTGGVGGATGAGSNVTAVSLWLESPAESTTVRRNTACVLADRAVTVALGAAALDRVTLPPSTLQLLLANDRPVVTLDRSPSTTVVLPFTVFTAPGLAAGRLFLAACTASRAFKIPGPQILVVQPHSASALPEVEGAGHRSSDTGKGLAVLIKMDATCSGVSDGLTASMLATTPDTIGAEKLVPMPETILWLGEGRCVLLLLASKMPSEPLAVPPGANTVVLLP